MNNFLLKVLKFLIIPLITLLSVDVFLRNSNSLYKEKYEGAIAQKDSIDILILGNSHANYGVDPRAFDIYAYNLANVKQSIYFDKRLTLSLMPTLKNLNYVLISVDYHSLYFSSQDFRDNWSYYGHGIKYRDKSYLAANISPFFFGYSPKVSISLIKKRIGNFLQYGNGAIDFDVEYGINLQDTIYHGFLTFETINESLFTVESFQANIKQFNDLIENSNEKNDILTDLTDFIEILIENDITPILFTTPTYSEYNQYLDEKVMEDNLQDIEKICDEYNIEYWNFMNSNLFYKDDFYNGDHLNKKGSLKFGQILNELINNLEVNETDLMSHN